MKNLQGRTTSLKLPHLLCHQWGIDPLRISPLGGYSNASYHVKEKGETDSVLRISRRNRTKNSVLIEEHILSHLPLPLTPKLLNSSYVQEEAHTSFAHRFSFLKGKREYFWWELCSATQIERLFDTLFELYTSMALIPPLPIVSEKQALPEIPPAILQKTKVGTYVQKHWKTFYSKALHIASTIEKAFPWDKAHFQWVHGDINLENVLFEGDSISGLCDFEGAGWDALEKEIIFSAFRLCKKGTFDEVFSYDERLLQKAIDTYLQNNPKVSLAFFTHYESLWKPFFCLKEASLYLHHAFDGIWELKEHTGFLPCFQEVLTYKIV